MVEVSLGRVGLYGSRDICELSHFYVRVDLFLDQVVSTRQLCCKYCTAFRAKECPERLNAHTCTYGTNCCNIERRQRTPSDRAT